MTFIFLSLENISWNMGMKSNANLEVISSVEVLAAIINRQTNRKNNLTMGSRLMKGYPCCWIEINRRWVNKDVMNKQIRLFATLWHRWRFGENGARLSLGETKKATWKWKTKNELRKREREGKERVITRCRNGKKVREIKGRERKKKIRKIGNVSTWIKILKKTFLCIVHKIWAVQSVWQRHSNVSFCWLKPHKVNFFNKFSHSSFDTFL